MGAVEQVVSAARKAYNADPTPVQMQRILGAMILDMAAVYQQASGVESGNPLADEWMEDFKNFRHRLYDYQIVLKAFTGDIKPSLAAKHHYIPVSWWLSPSWRATRPPPSHPSRGRIRLWGARRMWPRQSSCQGV
jgi:hypothetical protein